MCIVALAWQSHPRWKLVLIGNRDELHARPAEPLDRWDNPDHLIAGRDSQAGGTWLGVSEQGRLAVITNVSSENGPDSDKYSRGDLLKDYLSGKGRYADFGADDFHDFNPFNLVTVAGDKALIHSNRPEPGSDILQPGLHGLSNGMLDRPWPKSARLTKALDQWLSGAADRPALLLDTLMDRTACLPDADGKAATDWESSIEPQYSSIFIHNPVYGTRCSTVVAIDRDGAGSILERRFDASGTVTGETALPFDWSR